MLFRTHIAFSVLLHLLIIDWIQIPSLLFLAVFLFFSLAPDLDDYSSKISKKLRILSFPIKFLFEHRGFLHSIFIPFLLSLGLFLLNHKYLALAVILGYSSHLFLDAITLEGIRPFYPFKKKLKGFIRVNSIIETIFFVVVLALIIYKLF